MRRRRPGRDPVREPAGVGDRRLRLPRPRAAPTCRSIPPCPPARSSTSCATPAPWRSCVSTAAQLEKMLSIREQLPALRHVIAFDARRARPGRARRSTSCWPAAGRRSARHPRLARRRARRGAGRPRHAHLHLGHDGRSQGRDADARQHRLERDHLRRAVRASPRATSASRSCRSRTSSSGCSATTRCSTPAW